MQKTWNGMHYFKTIKSPLGKLTLISNDEALVALYVNDELMPLIATALKNDSHKILLKAEVQLNEYFNGTRKKFDLPLAPKGTEFQSKAWNALMDIPYGEIWSYGQQAKYLKNPKGQRAVGGANGKNPIPVIIPCHRVIGSTGKLTGFSGGMSMKIFLLKLEGHQIDIDGLKLNSI
jgi:methylated-DNA-[protein]-cysteine S-methyltransferase